ncbi:MAG: hypothetical protein Q3983_07935 [Capnocytophaga sp.]|nr:hypothetical protein [Capnocytophaga sp.]
MQQNYPNSLVDYYRSRSETFELRSDKTKKTFNIVLLLIFLVILIYPEIIPFGELWILRIIAVIGMIYAGVKAFLLDSDFWNKQTNTKITEFAIKKFSSASTTEEDLRNLLNNNDFETLVNLPAADNQPLQLYIHEDKDGKVFYLLLMKYYTKSDFSGASAVKVISGADYNQYKNIINKFK